MYDITSLRKYIADFCVDFDYPADAEEDLLDCFDRVCGNDGAWEKFLNIVQGYEADQLLEISPLAEQLVDPAPVGEQENKVVKLLVYIALTRHMHALYRKNGYSEELYRAAASDLKWKLIECRKNFGVNGTMTTWYDRFFFLTRFALGRLQFETSQAREDFSCAYGDVHAGDLAINVHIPSCGKLKPELVLDAFQRAEQFYKPLFGDKPVVIICSSWLLYPRHRDMLPEDSNIIQFMNCYTITQMYEGERFGDLWRLFDTAFTGDIDALPADNAFRRAYIAHLKKNHCAGSGYGILFIKDGKILPIEKERSL